MKYITLEQIKKQLNIDNDFIEDDAYLEHLCNTAIEATEKHLDIKFSDIEINNDIPDTIKHSILLLIGQLYNNREIDTDKTVNKVNNGYDFLTALNKRYTVI